MNHETLQHILAKLQSDAPDDEVFALVYAFDYRKSAVVLPGMAEIQGEPVKERRRRATAYKSGLGERVALIEACCISYFRPSQYNTHYLDFPNRNHKILDPIYRADFAAIFVQLDNTNIGGQRIYSSNVPAASTHYIASTLGDWRGNIRLSPCSIGS